MHPQRTLIEAAEQVVINEDLLGVHPEGKGHDDKGSVGTDTIPAHVMAQLPEQYKDFKPVGPEHRVGKGTVVVSYKGSFLGKDRNHHVTLANPELHKSYVDMRIADHDRWKNYGFRA